MKKFINTYAKLIDFPQLRMGNPILTLNKDYLILDVDGSNFIFLDDVGDECSIGSCRFKLN